ncbi:methyltransferase domain-containing protein [Ruegeria jejuensis]|uniref:methyltransferase domain-containing protein n=1 Tax=Ruegeria jejuensis TaxID=3233338 RepID=UPI00355C2248
MERMDALPEDFDLLRIREDLAELFRIAERANEEKKILAAALNAIGDWSELEIENRDGQFDYIPIDINSFFGLMYDLERALSLDPDYKHSDVLHRPCSFIEVGCGIGRNLHLLRATDKFNFDKIVGFDYSETYVERGRRYFDLGQDIFHDDAMSFDYGSYDIIYFYKPFSEDKLQKKFERHLIETMKPGAYIASFMDVSLDSSRKLIAKGDGHGVWKKL